MLISKTYQLNQNWLAEMMEISSGDHSCQTPKHFVPSVLEQLLC